MCSTININPKPWTHVQLRVNIKPAFSPSDLAFARHIFTVKHGKPVALYLAWRCLVTLLQSCAAPGAANFSTVTDVETGEVSWCVQVRAYLPDKMTLQHLTPKWVGVISYISNYSNSFPNQIVALFVEFRQKTMHHFITAMVAHEASQKVSLFPSGFRDLNRWNL